MTKQDWKQLKHLIRLAYYYKSIETGKRLEPEIAHKKVLGIIGLYDFRTRNHLYNVLTYADDTRRKHEKQ